MANIKSALTSKTQDWSTPLWLVHKLEDEFGPISLDPCASPLNAKASAFFTKEDNGLAYTWWGTAFVNPPYNAIAAWAEKSFQEAFAGNATVLFLCAARTDTRWWWKWCRFGEVRLIQGRLKFGLDDGPTDYPAPFPSALVVFRRNLDRYTPSTVYWDIPQTERR